MSKYVLGADVLGARGQKIPLVGASDGKVSPTMWAVFGVALAGMLAAGAHYMRAK